jgi:hypothetical protein
MKCYQKSTDFGDFDAMNFYVFSLQIESDRENLQSFLIKLIMEFITAE